MKHNPIILYHASREPMLDKKGLKTNCKTTCCRNRNSNEIYLGTLEYLSKDYFSYCPKGMYFIYKVNVENLPLTKVNAGEQWKTGCNISNERVEFFEQFYRR